VLREADTASVFVMVLNWLTVKLTSVPRKYISSCCTIIDAEKEALTTRHKSFSKRYIIIRNGLHFRQNKASQYNLVTLARVHLTRERDSHTPLQHLDYADYSSIQN
jgi:hypothetical protein